MPVFLLFTLGGWRGVAIVCTCADCRGRCLREFLRERPLKGEASQLEWRWLRGLRSPDPLLN